MKGYKVIKGISVFFALLTLAAVVCLIFIEMNDLTMLKDTSEIYTKVCEAMMLDPAAETIKVDLMHYITVALGSLYVLTFIMWLITFRTGARALRSKRAIRRPVQSADTVKVNTAKDISALKKKAKEVVKKIKREKKVEEVPAVAVNVEKPKSESDKKLSNILDNL